MSSMLIINSMFTSQAVITHASNMSHHHSALSLWEETQENNQMRIQLLRAHFISQVNLQK